MIGSFGRFFQKPTAPGIFLGLATITALAMVNSPLRPLYDALIETPAVFRIGDFIIEKPLVLWINDGLMAIFFLLIGLEIKREIITGHLASREQFILPVVAAIGGLAVPALIYSFINWGDSETLQGWAIPAATDIAFALGVVLLLGNRVPPALKVLLVAVAIVDDLAAIVIIAVFYTADLSLLSLLGAFIGLGAVAVLNAFNVTRLGPYMVLGLIIWAFVLKSGVHATLAGVALGLLIPLRTANKSGDAPLLVLEHALHPWVAFGVIPLFAFANAGVSLRGLGLDSFIQPVTLGIVLGLFLGKQIGVMAATLLAVKFRIATLPDGISWRQYYGMALLTGIGFTMSLFIGTLAFTTVDQATAVRLGVLAGSLLSGLSGVAVLLWPKKM